MRSERAVMASCVVSLTEAQRYFHELVERVRRGKVVHITKYGKLKARMEPISEVRTASRRNKARGTAARRKK